MRFILLTIVFVGCWHSVLSQSFFDKKTGSEEVVSLLKKHKGKEVGFFSKVDFNKDAENYNLFIIKNKSTKLWGIMKTTDWDGKEFEYLVPPIYDSIGDLTDESDIVIFKKNNDYGVASIEWEKESIKVDCSYDEIKQVEKEGRDFTLVRQKNKWGLFQVEYSFLSVPCVYQNENDVPLYRVSSYDYQTFVENKDKLGIVGFRPDGNGDGVFYGCGKDGKWGLFQMDSEIIPMKYDKIEPMSFNAPFLIVYNDNKAGVYSNPFGDCKMTVLCKYDELKRFTADGYFFCAARKENKWAIVDWYTGEETTEFVWDAFNDIRIRRSSLSKFYQY